MPNPRIHMKIFNRNLIKKIYRTTDSKNVVKIEDDNGDSGNNEENNDGELKTIGNKTIN